MGHIAHANTKPRVRKEIQKSNETIAVLAKRYNLNPKTVSKKESIKNGNTLFLPPLCSE